MRKGEYYEALLAIMPFVGYIRGSVRLEAQS